MACEEQTDNLKKKVGQLKDQFQAELAAISQQAKDEADDIDPDIDTNDPLVYVGANFEIRWRRVDWSMDLPDIYIDDQKISFDVPSVTMRTKDISFDLPVTRMERREGPPYPEFKCGGFPPQCTVTWSKSYFDVPVVTMETQRFSMDLPEVSMRTQEIVLGIPQVKMETQHFSFDVPEFVLKDIEVEAQEAKEKGEALQKETNDKLNAAKSNFAALCQQQTGSEFSAFVDCQTNFLTEQLSKGLEQFDSALRTMQGFIDGLRGQKVPEDNPELSKLVGSVNATMAARSTFDQDMHAQIQALPALHEKFVNALLQQS